MTSGVQGHWLLLPLPLLPMPFPLLIVHVSC